MSVYRDIYEKISATQPFKEGPLYRVIKIQEEAGEVAEAVIGFVGANKRKGITHNEKAVAKELVDVVVTAMIALHDWVPSPERFVEERLRELLVRIKEEGS